MFVVVVVGGVRSQINEYADNPPVPAPQFSTVFEHGMDGWPDYRIPALLATRKGTLLAFAEGRQSLSDHSQNNIILKRSTDSGRSWKAIQVVHEAGSNILVNPCAVALDFGRVLLMYQYFPAAFHSRNMGKNIKRLSPGLAGTNVSLTLLQWSDDDGVTWSRPRDVTRQTKRPEGVYFTCSGPGIGLQLKRGPRRGRILIPTGEGTWDESHVFACISDDGGETWRMGKNTTSGKTISSEAQFVELADGAILLNVRCSEENENKTRKTSVSHDGGETWSPFQDNPQLPEPSCMATILRYSWPEDGRSLILFANPASQTARTNGMIRLSYDEGQIWPVAKIICPGFYAYSCLTKLADGSIGCLFETDGAKRIVFARFQLAWLTDAQGAPQPGRVEAN